MGFSLFPRSVKFYDLFKEVDAVKEGVDRLIKQGDIEKAQARMAKYDTQLKQLSAMKDAKEFVSDAGSAIRAIELNRTMSPEEKRAQIDVLRRHGYAGWLVVEAEQDPAKAPPLATVTRARQFIEALLA